KLVENGAEVGTYLGKKLEELRAHPTVGDVRGVGMLWATELVKSKTEKTRWGRDHSFLKRVNDLLMERGMISRVWDVIHFAPPLTVTKAQIDEIVGATDEALSIAEKEYAAEISA